MGRGDLRFEAACNEAFYCDGDVTYIVFTWKNKQSVGKRNPFGHVYGESVWCKELQSD